MTFYNQMFAESIEKQIVNWNIHTFQHLNNFVGLINRVQQKKPAKEEDYRLRDFYFKPSLEYFGLKPHTTFIEHAAEIIKNFFSFNQLGYLQSLAFENHMEMHRFWNNLYRKPVSTKQDLENKSQVQNIVWTYRLIPFTIFLFGAAAILKVTGVDRMSLRKRAVALLVAVFVSDVFVRTRKSSEIFYLIPELYDNVLQGQRVELLNKGLVLDGKINEVEFRPELVDELIEIADKQPDYEERKLILEAAGFKVIDTIDAEYI